MQNTHKKFNKLLLLPAQEGRAWGGRGGRLGLEERESLYRRRAEGSQAVFGSTGARSHSLTQGRSQEVSLAFVCHAL